MNPPLGFILTGKHSNKYLQTNLALHLLTFGPAHGHERGPGTLDKQTLDFEVTNSDATTLRGVYIREKFAALRFIFMRERPGIAILYYYSLSLILFELSLSHTHVPPCSIKVFPLSTSRKSACANT